MKNFVSVIAALSLMLSAVPAITSYAAETATASITSEVSAETTDIAHIAGEWKYQSSDTNLPVNITPTDYGTVVINKDGTYTFTDLKGKTSTGTVQFSIETIGGTPFQCISLYEGEERRFGGYYLTAQGKANADVNGGGLTVGDAQAIQKALLNK